MSRGRRFFATAADVLPGLVQFEAARSVRYLQTGLFDENIPREYETAADIPQLSVAVTGDAGTERSFLVVARKVQVRIRRVPQRAGGVKWAIDQLENPDSTVLQPGGVFDIGVLIAGQIGTTGVTGDAVALHQFMVKQVTKGFRRVQSFWLGPAALTLFEEGWRLTSGVRSPRDYDLRVEDAC